MSRTITGGKLPTPSEIPFGPGASRRAFWYDDFEAKEFQTLVTTHSFQWKHSPISVGFHEIYLYPFTSKGGYIVLQTLIDDSLVQFLSRGEPVGQGFITEDLDPLFYSRFRFTPQVDPGDDFQQGIGFSDDMTFTFPTGVIMIYYSPSFLGPNFFLIVFNAVTPSLDFIDLGFGPTDVFHEVFLNFINGTVQVYWRDNPNTGGVWTLLYTYSLNPLPTVPMTFGAYQTILAMVGPVNILLETDVIYVEQNRFTGDSYET